MISRQSGKPGIPSIEPPCRKKIYTTQQEALDMISFIEETRVSKKIRAYQCPVCGYWHLTSSAQGRKP